MRDRKRDPDRKWVGDTWKFPPCRSNSPRKPPLGSGTQGRRLCLTLGAEQEVTSSQPQAESLSLFPALSLAPPTPPRPCPHLHSASSSSNDVSKVTRPQATWSFGNPE